MGTPRKQNHDTKINLIMKKTSDEEVVNEEEEEELLALSPQPSIVSTITHGATKQRNTNSLQGHQSEKNNKLKISEKPLIVTVKKSSVRTESDKTEHESPGK